MIPLRLQSELKERFEKLFADKQYERPPKDAESPTEKYYDQMKVFQQNLPIKTKADDVYAPFIIVQLHTGNQPSTNAKNTVNVYVLVGMFDSSGSSGYQDVAQALNQVIDDLKKFPKFADHYELDLESSIDWELSEEETYPYYYGGVSLHFKMPILEFGERYDLEGLI